MNTSKNKDIAAFEAIYKILEPLDEETRERVFTSVATMLNMKTYGVGPSKPFKGSQTPETEDGVVDGKRNLFEYDTFAELYASAGPTSNADKALIAGYWLQVCQGAGNFTGHSANKELADLGYRLTRITDALSFLINAKPELVLQIKKQGRSRQARKIYKLSKAGINQVEEMING